ncbi:PUB domain protein [Ostertagia ostertagi]
MVISVVFRSGPDIREFEHADVIKGVYFTCELLGGDEAMTKPVLMQAIEDFLMSQLLCEGEDAVVPAVLLLYSLNKKPAREVAVETIGKYLQNIIENPGEAKYRRIRMSNKVFQVCIFLKVATIKSFLIHRFRNEWLASKGGVQFLNAVGFKETMEPLKDGDAPERFLVIPENAASDTGHLVTALSLLRDGQSVPIKVSRETTIYHVGENERIPMPRLPADFFDLTAEEIRREQQNKTEEVNRVSVSIHQLITCFVGTFGCYEPLSVVREYIAKHLSNQAALFSLYNPVRGSEPLVDENKSLAALGMSSEPTRDSTTLKNISERRPDSFLLLNPRPEKLVTEPVKPSPIIERKLDVDIHKVPFDLDESDTSSSDESSCSDDDLDSETESEPKVEFNLSLFREDDSTASSATSGPSLIPQEVELLPEAFREDGCPKCDDRNTNKSKALIEEI